MSLGTCQHCGRELIHLVGQEDAVRCRRCGVAPDGMIERPKPVHPDPYIPPAMIQPGMTVLPIGGEQMATIQAQDVRVVAQAQVAPAKQKRGRR